MHFNFFQGEGKRLFQNISYLASQHISKQNSQLNNLVDLVDE
jgi:hypothetical protein